MSANDAKRPVTNEYEAGTEQPIQQESGDGTGTTPNKGYHSGRWRGLDSHDRQTAMGLHTTLAGISGDFVSARIFTGDAGFNTWEVNQRAILHDTVDEICREDLKTLSRIGQLLFASYDGGRGPLQTMAWALGQSCDTLAAAGLDEFVDMELDRMAEVQKRLVALDAELAIQETEAILDEAWQAS